MKPNFKKPLILTTLISITLLSGCGGSGDKEQSSGRGGNQQAAGGGGNQQATGKGGEAKQGMPVVKGLQLGMTSDEVLEVLKSDTFKKFGTPSYVVDDLYPNGYFHFNSKISSALVTTDENKKLNWVRFEGSRDPRRKRNPEWADAIQILWNASAVSSSEFAKKFADAYGIPKFESKLDDDLNHYWLYQDSKLGYKIEIFTFGQDPGTDPVSMILMQKIQKLGDTKFDD
ncbi:MAG: hypothetical protein CMO74_14895 [Verrucomicrobiales bacterium]|nr:hypothetical protein [Verrucomicrobiales bacterium]|tara:strand:- start:166 stop:852 length:687 start_codon:yes stop_codon:yes gene_type:complete